MCICVVCVVCVFVVFCVCGVCVQERLAGVVVVNLSDEDKRVSATQTVQALEPVATTTRTTVVRRIGLLLCMC